MGPWWLMGGKLLCIRVEIDLALLVTRFVILRVGFGSMRWGKVYFECLPLLCFYCEVVDHGETECPNDENTMDESKPFEYGEWLALPRFQWISLGVQGRGNRVFHLVSTSELLENVIHMWKSRDLICLTVLLKRREHIVKWSPIEVQLLRILISTC